MTNNKPTYEELKNRVTELEARLRRTATDSARDFQRELEAMRLDESTLLDIIRLNPYAIAFFDSNGVFIESNGAYRNMFPETPTPDYSIFQDELMRRLGFLDQLLGLKQGRIVNIPEVAYNPKDVNPRYPDFPVCFKIVAFPIMDKSGALDKVIVMYEDVTAQKQAEKDRERLTAQLIQAQKMEAVGHLAGGVAHEFNNILSVIVGNADMALKTMAGNDPNRTRIQKSLKVALRARDLTMKLLTFARKDKLSVRVVSPNALMNEAIDMLDPGLLKKITLRREFAPDNGHVEADVNQMIQGLLNLCINACDAMPRGGELLLRTGATTLQRNDGRLKPDLPPGDYCLLEVLDTGSGVPRDILDKICEPFFTTKTQGHGTGLGLSVTLGIIRSHNGFLEVANRAQAGMRATLYLPRVPAPDARSRPANRDKPLATHPHGTRVLVVDDDPDILTMLRDILALRGFAPLCAASGAQALEMFAQHAQSIRLVLLDIIMPGMDGGEVFHKLRAVDPETTIVLCSGYSAEGLAEDLLSQGAAGFLQKPFVISELDSILSRVLAP